MNDEHYLAQKEWIIVCIFLMLIGVLIGISSISDIKIDGEIEDYLHAQRSKSGLVHSDKVDGKR